MDLRCLRNFVATAEALSFRKAAESQFISQPALSRQIAGLEVELGVELFSRSGRGVQLTRAGRVFVGEARQLLADADRALAAVRDISTNDTPTLSIGFSADAVAGPVADLLRDLRLAFPGIPVELDGGCSPRHEQQLALGDLDVAISYLPHSIGENYCMLPCWEVAFGLLIPTSHPAADAGPRSIADFSRDRILIPTDEVGRYQRERLVHYCVDAGFEPSLEECHSVAGTKVAVAAGRGVGFVYEEDDTVTPDGTAFVQLRPTPPHSVVGLVWNRSNESEALQRLLELAGSSTARHVTAPRPAQPALDLALA